MRAFLQRTDRFLAEPIDLAARFMLLAAAALLVATYFFPLWNLTMFAPQYPDGLRLDIYSYTMVGGHNGQDVKEINLLNHYIGMQDLAVESFTEFKWMPFVIGALGLLILRAAVHGTVAALVDVTMMSLYFGAFSLWSFGYKLYRYGHDLSPTAAVQVPPFTPPMFGGQQIANFEVYSYPRAASYAMAGAVLLLVGALVLTWWTDRRAGAADGRPS
jgi:hypothetical protein